MAINRRDFIRAQAATVAATALQATPEDRETTCFRLSGGGRGGAALGGGGRTVSSAKARMGLCSNRSSASLNSKEVCFLFMVVFCYFVLYSFGLASLDGDNVLLGSGR